MRAKVFCMASSKGGSGKTVLTATFGAFLSSLGRKVLLVDTDAATNGLTLLYIKEVLLQSEYALSERHEPMGIYEGISEVSPPEIVKLKSGPDFIPATYQFKNTEQIPPDIYRLSLHSAISLSRDSYDYIFLDAQAGSDVYAQIAMSREISDEVVIVSEYDPMSAAGVERLKGLMREDLTYVRTWVLLNKMLPDFVKSFNDFLEVAKYLSPIPWDADVVRAYARRRLAIDLESGNDYTLAVLQSLKGLLGDEISTDLDAWAKQRAAIIRQPISEQYEDTVKQLDALVAARYEKKASLGRGSRRRSTLYLLILLVTGIVLAVMFYNEVTITWIIIVEVIGISLSLGTLVYDRFATRKPSLEQELEFRHLERTINSLEDKLKKLEVLKAADLEVLIKDRQKGLTV